MCKVQCADWKGDKKLVSLNGVHWLKNVTLGDNISQSDFEGIQRGDYIFCHINGEGVTTILSITKWNDLPESTRDAGMVHPGDIRLSIWD